MVKKAAFAIVFLAVFGGAIYGILYFDKISVGPKIEIPPMDLSQLGYQHEITQDEMWISSLSSQEDLPYAYPATELSVKFDFVDKDSAKAPIPSAISINDLDEYKFACVKQVLKENHIESAYYKSGDTLKLMVFLTDESMYKKLLADLKYYRLNYSVQ